MVEKIFFQSSMPRSLSTLFQNLISQNPDFYVTPTSGTLELLYAARNNYTNSPEFKAQDAELMQKGFAGFCKGGLHGFFDSITDKKYVLDKSRGWGVYKGFLDSFYPDAKVICLVRNLKDVVASYEKIYRKNQHQADPIRNDSNGRGTTLPKRVDEWMHPTNTIGRAVERISEMMTLGYDSKVLFIKSEDLCLYPESTMVKVYDYLEVPYFSHDFDNIEQLTQEDDNVYGLGAGLHTIRPKLEMKPSDADKVLDTHVRQWLYDTYRWYYQKFNYSK